MCDIFYVYAMQVRAHHMYIWTWMRSHIYTLSEYTFTLPSSSSSAYTYIKCISGRCALHSYVPYTTHGLVYVIFECDANSASFLLVACCARFVRLFSIQFLLHFLLCALALGTYIPIYTQYDIFTWIYVRRFKIYWSQTYVHVYLHMSILVIVCRWQRELK